MTSAPPVTKQNADGQWTVTYQGKTWVFWTEYDADRFALMLKHGKS